MTYRIAEAAELVGVPATTLRYYEDIGLVERPARGGNGYRTYDDVDLARLRFITATKNLGIPLADVAELVKAYDVEDCSTVAHQVVEMVAQRLAETQTRIGELVALAAQLQTVSARLAEPPAAGPCGDGCPCATAAPAPLADRRTFVPLMRGPAAAPDEPVVACSLDAGSVPNRISDWQALPGAINVPGELTPAEASRIAPDPRRTVVVSCSGPGCGRSKVTPPPRSSASATATSGEKVPAPEPLPVMPAGERSRLRGHLRLGAQHAEEVALRVRERHPAGTRTVDPPMSSCHVAPCASSDRNSSSRSEDRGRRSKWMRFLPGVGSGTSMNRIWWPVSGSRIMHSPSPGLLGSSSRTE